MAKTLVVTTDNLGKDKVEKAGLEAIWSFAIQSIKEKDEITEPGVYRIEKTDGSVTIYTAESVDLEAAFVEQLIDANIDEPDDLEVATATDLYLAWVDGYKRQHINRAAHEAVATALGLKEPSKRAEAIKKTEERIYGEMVGKLVAAGKSEDEAKRIVYGK